MSIFTDAAASADLERRALIEPALPEDMTVGAGLGIGRALFSVPGSLAVRAGAMLPQALEPFRGPIGAVGSMLGVDAAGWLSDWQEAGRRTVARSLPRPWEMGEAGGLVYGLAVPVAEFAGAYAAGGPSLAALYTGMTARMQRSIELEREGVDRAMADFASLPAAVAQGSSAFLPGFLGFGQSLAARIGTDVVGQGLLNVAAGVPQRAAERGILEGEYRKLAETIKPFGMGEMALDFAFGALLSGAFHGLGLGARGLEATRRDLGLPLAQDVLAARDIAHAHVDTRPGAPRSPADAEAHVEALVLATEQMARGEQVNVAGLVNMDGFDAPRTDPLGTDLDDVRLAIVREAEGERAASFGYASDTELRPLTPPPKKPWTATLAAGAGRVLNPVLERPGEAIGPLEYARRARSSFIARLRAAGGIELAEAVDIAGERANKLPPGLFHRAGRSIDHHTEWMVEAGFIGRDEADADVGGGVWRTRDLIRQALDGRPVYTPEQAMRVAELEAANDATPDAETAAERAAIQAESWITESDLEGAGFFDLRPLDQVDVDRWVDYSREAGLSHDDIETILDAHAGLGAGETRRDPAGSFAGVEGENPGDDPVGESAQSGARRVAEGDRQGGERVGDEAYTVDAFGEPIPDRAGADRSGSAEGSGEVDAPRPAAVQDPTEVAENSFAAATFSRRIGSVSIGVQTVTSAADAAHVFAYLRKFPVEHIAVLSVDADARPIAITSISVGERAGAGYDTHSIVGAALRDSRTAAVWVAHNHPSKTADLSSADKTVNRTIRLVLHDAGVRVEGFMAIAGTKFAHIGHPDDGQIVGDIVPMARRFVVPLQERMFKRNGVLVDAIVDHPAKAIAIGSKIAAGRSGVLLLNHQRAPVAWVTMGDAPRNVDADAATRRSFMSALEAANASSLVYVHNGPLADVPASVVQSVVRNAGMAQVRVLDIVSVHDRTSRESGGVPMGRASAAEPGDDILTGYTNDDILEREQQRLAAAGVDNAQQSAARKKAEADAQRDTFALAGSDREADAAAARGQGALFEPAPAVYGAPSPLARWFGKSKVVDADGKPLRVYHGAGRPDRVGNKFRKSRATSGPMAFFTDNPDIAGSYAKGKQDTSLTGDELEYSQWFQYRAPGARSSVPIDRAWWSLDADVRAKIAAEAPKLRLDDEGNVIAEDGNRSGNGSYDHEIKQSRGNALRALVEDWLSSGVLFGNEAVFVRVLKAAGFPVERVDFVEQNASTPAVFPVYLRIERPLDTSAIDARTFAALEEAGARKRGGSIGADPWDKNLRSGREWLDALKKDMDEGTSLAWTSIPDWVTSALRGLGYDGIKDSGGKHGGERHNVWVPFDEGQVKSASGNRGTFDDSTNMVREPAVGYESGPQDYRNFPGTLAVPVPRDVLIAAADARVAEADMADAAVAAAVRCALAVGD